MKRVRYLLLFVIAAAVLVRSGQGCAFSEEDDVPSRVDPDRPYSAFLDGRLGVLSGQLRVRHLVVAYNILSGRGLTPGERKAAADVDQFYNYNGGVGPEVPPPDDDAGRQTTRAALKAWFAAAPETSTRTEHGVPGEDFSSFANCLDDAYVNAAKTLADLRMRYGKPGAQQAVAGTAPQDTPEIREWIAGQVAVFSNCSDQPAAVTYGPEGRKVTPGPPAVMPSALPATAPLWLRQARQYQVAAADFYALRYDQALAEFDAIAAQKTSPYATLARYVAARTLIRRATVPQLEGKTPEASAFAEATRLQHLAEARAALQAIGRDSSMQPFHGPAQHLLDYVNLRLDPTAQAEELSRRLSAPASPERSGAGIDMQYRQNVIDLTYALLSSSNTPAPPKPAPAYQPSNPLLRWIVDIKQPDPSGEGNTAMLLQRSPALQLADAAAEWRGTRSPEWLVALLSAATPGSADQAQAVSAARNVPQGSPAWASVTYNRLRLERESTGHASYIEVAALMASIEKTQPRSAINLFADLESGAAPSLDLFLKSATRITPQSIQSEPGEGFPAPSQTGAAGDPAAADATKNNTLCAVPLNQQETPHLGAETATVFNERMPLALLEQAALSDVLPRNVRFVVAHMAWTRAVLLGRPEVARSLGPFLGTCQPAFRQWLDAYNNAKTPDAQKVAGLMGLMRFTSTSPVVRPNMEPDFASYDAIRDYNWWCDANVPYEGQTKPDPDRKPTIFSQPVVPRGKPPQGQPDPPFLTAADQAAVDRELAQLKAVGDAGDYFAREALAWVKAHPDDPQNPDVLGFAMRAVRNTCRSNATKQLNHQLFDTLHRKYPKSSWATRYTTWE